MNDLEQDLRDMLADRADRVVPDPDARRAIADKITHGIPADVVPLSPGRSPFRPVRILAVAASVAVLVGAVALLTRDAGRDVDAPIASGDPEGQVHLDEIPGTGQPVFGRGAGFADPTAAAEAYLRAREVGPEVHLSEATGTGDEAAVDYTAFQPAPGGGGDVVVLGSGRVHLRNDGSGWVVLASVAGGIVVDDASIRFTDDGRDEVHLTGSTGQTPAAVRITSPRGDDLLGDGREPLTADEFDVTVPVDPAADHVQVVVEEVGGSVFAVTEFSLTSPPDRCSAFPPAPTRRRPPPSSPRARDGTCTAPTTSVGWTVQIASCGCRRSSTRSRSATGSTPRTACSSPVPATCRSASSRCRSSTGRSAVDSPPPTKGR